MGRWEYAHVCTRTYTTRVKSSVGPHFTTSKAALWSKPINRPLTGLPASSLWPSHFTVARAILSMTRAPPGSHCLYPGPCSLNSSLHSTGPSTAWNILPLHCGSLPHLLPVSAELPLICEAFHTTLYKITVPSCSSPPPYPTSFFFIACIPPAQYIFVYCVSPRN